MKPFVHLHLHTEYSLLDGAARIDYLFALAKEKNMPAVAITDHGNMYGLFKFYEEALRAGIKPIVGCEFYCCADMESRTGRQDYDHLILLAKDETGYKNLIYLDSLAFTKGKYYKPRIDYKLLSEHSQGLICLSACLAGRIPQFLIGNRYDDALEFAKYLKGMFADGDFYIELQNHGIAEQLKILPNLKKIANAIGVKCVATNDVHYLKQEDAKMQDVMLCIQTARNIDDEDRMRMSGNEFYLKNYDEMAEAMEGYEESLDTTIEIMDKCNLIIRSKSHSDVTKDARYHLAKTENFIPKYVNSLGIDNYDFLRQMAYDGLKKLYGVNLDPKYIDRAEYELELIKRLGFVEYFLVVWDYINYAESVGIPVGVGRGSGAGSIVAYSIGITKIDPMKYDLLFERFINPERVSMPDFDIDFCVERRGEVIEYVKRKYGDDHVALIITFGTMAAKNAIRDVARVMRVPLAEVEKLTKLIPLKLPDGIRKPPVLKYYFGKTGKAENEQFVIEDLRTMYNDSEMVRDVVDMAIELEGMPRNCSTHAAGVLICPDPVYEHVALSKIDSDVSTQCSMNELEHLGLLKMDFLGLRTLTDINKTLQYVKKNYGVTIDFEKLGYDDPNVYKLISAGDVDAVFQLESAGMKKFMKNLKPTCLEDIIAGVALYRPGPMDSIPRYIENKHNPDDITYASPVLEPILNVTYGCIVYQEQVMRIVQEMAGYSLSQADNIRRTMSKKKADEMVKEREFFINGKRDENGKVLIPGAVAKGVPAEVAAAIFDEMESFARYAFNKSHAAAYAYITYQTAYLKTYYQPEFLSAVLNNRIANIDEIRRYVVVAKAHDIPILPPDINLSQTYFSTDGKSIRFGLAAIKNVGLAVIEAIIAEREVNGSYKDLMDFVSRVPSTALNKRCIESLILTGAFDSFGKQRSQLMGVYSVAIERVNERKKMAMSGQYNMFDTIFSSAEDMSGLEYPNINEFVHEVMLGYEKEMAGVYLSGHPLDAYRDKVKQFTLTSDMMKPDEIDAEDENEEHEETYSNIKANDIVVCGGALDEIKLHITKNGQKMAFATLEDMLGNIELVFFTKTFDRYKDRLTKNALMTIKGRIVMRDGMPPSVSVDSVDVWDKPKEDEIVETPIITTIQKKLCLTYDVQNKSLHNGVLKILSDYSGQDKVYVKDINSGEKFALNVEVEVRESLLFELSTIIKKENIVVI